MAGLLDPNEDFISPDERKAITQQNLFSTLLQGGMQLVAGGENLLPWQRAQMIGQAAQTFGGMPAQNQQMLANAAQQKLVGQRVAKDRRTEAADAELMKVGENPAFLETLKQMPADLQSMIPALFKSGRARDAVTLVDNWRTNQSRETALNARENRPPPGYRLSADGLRHEYIPGGLADPAQAELLARSKRDLKAIPPSENDKLSIGASTILNIDKIIGSIDSPQPGQEPSDRFAGWVSRNVPGGELIAQTINPSGVDARAAIADVSSQLLQARSGLAVTEGEYRRLTSLLPNPAEEPKVIKQKLQKIRENLTNTMRYQSAQYTEKNGYVPHSGASTWGDGAQAPQQQGGEGGGSPTASDLKEGHVTTFRNGQKWSLQGGKPVRVQ